MATYQWLPVGEHDVFYREAGDRARPALLLLHGFPTSSFMFRDLIPLLATEYHVIAPDLPGFGLTRSPQRDRFNYRFETLTDVIDGFIAALGLEQFSLYVFDYGAPIGFRLALRMPDKITAIISQNGNAYEDGLSEGWAPIRHLWAHGDDASRETIRGFYGLDGIRHQYLTGVDDESAVSPDGYHLDALMLARDGAQDIQFDLIEDYASNVALYDTFQRYFREWRPPVLAVWGRHDPFFVPAGAEAFRRDQPDAEVHLLDTGHFALETHAVEIAAHIRRFLGREVGAQVIDVAGSSTHDVD